MWVVPRLTLIGTLVAASVGCGGGLFRQYEYEEDMYVSLDGAATLYVNSSIPALNALRGTSFDVSPNARVDRDRVAAYFSSPVTHVTRRVATSRRNNRQFVHVRLEVDDVRRLAEAAPFAWSSYRFTKEGNLFVYQQTVGTPAGNRDQARWTGREIVAFRLHIPSKVIYDNAGAEKRGNILVWEQLLSERLRGTPVEVEARMADESILYRTLWLFGATFVAVAATFAMAIWWVFRRGAEEAAAA